jgi:hypothetical protein
VKKPSATVDNTLLRCLTIVWRSKPEVLDNVVKAALRVQGHYPGQADFVLVPRSDGEPEFEQRKREFRARATALGVPVYDETPNAGHCTPHLFDPKVVAIKSRFMA